MTHVLKDLLNDGLINGNVSDVLGSNVLVTALPPDRIDTGANSEQTGLNLFLYQTRPNPGWRNEGLPAFDGRGQRVANPPLALDLHYFLTAYGAEELHADILLGYGMQLFHETPVLARDAIRQSLSVARVGPNPPALPTLPPALRALATSNLAEQVEQIKISPESLGAEEMSRLWTAFQAKYRLTAAYKVTVVLIQSEKSTRSALPVQRRLVQALPFRQPLIDKIQSQGPGVADAVLDNQKILTGYRLILLGQQLNDDRVTVVIDGQDVPTESVTDSQITLIVPNTVSGGLHGIQVVHQHLMGDPPTEHRGGASNLESFVLSPTITGPLAIVGGKLTIPVEPPITATQRTVVLLNKIVVGPVGPDKAYSFAAPTPAPNSPPVSTISVPIPGVTPGTYLVRIQVDGAESPLTFSSLTGSYADPKITI